MVHMCATSGVMPSSDSRTSRGTGAAHTRASAMARVAMVALLVATCVDALALGTRAHGVVLGTRASAQAARAPAARLDLSSFEKSFMDDLYMEEYLEKNRALVACREALPSLLQSADAAALRRGIDEARECQAGVAELKPYIIELQKLDPSMITEVDEAILSAVDQVVEASKPQPAKMPLDSFLLPAQFDALLEASKSKIPAWDESQGECPDDLNTLWGRPNIFFSLLRHPRIDPSPVVWTAVRKEWPVLGNIPDDELMKNLYACRAEACDLRRL